MSAGWAASIYFLKQEKIEREREGRCDAAWPSLTLRAWADARCVLAHVCACAVCGDCATSVAGRVLSNGNEKVQQ